MWEAPPPRDQRPNAAFEFELEFEFDPLLGQWCGAVPFGVVAVDVVVVWAAWDREPPAAANATLPPAAAVQTAASARIRVSLWIPPPFDAAHMEAIEAKARLRRA